MARSHLARPIVIGVVLFVGCTTITEELPKRESQNPVAPIPIPVVVVPVPIPTPAQPAPAPAPNPAPNPAPAPAPTPPPSGAACNLPSGGGDGQNCARTSPSFLADVDRAINQLAQQRPSLFDFNDQQGGNGWRVLDATAYHQGVAQQLRSMGLCAVFDGEEIAVKNTNSFSDQYDIHLASGHVRRGLGSYRATCWPAWF